MKKTQQHYFRTNMLSRMQESFPKVFPMALIHEATTPKINIRDFLVKERNLGRASNVKATSREMPDLPDLRWAGCLRVRYVPRKAYHGWSSQTSKALSSGNPTCNFSYYTQRHHTLEINCIFWDS